MRTLRSALVALLLVSSPRVSVAIESDDAFHHWPIDLKINGQVILGHDLQDTALIGDVLDKDELSGSVVLLVDDDIKPGELIEYAALFSQARDYRVVKRDPAPQLTHDVR